MATGKTKAGVTLVFAAALIGGGAAGMLASRYLHPTAHVVVPGEAYLSSELQLTKDQQSQIRQIWEQVRDENQRSFEDGQALNQWRDDQVVKLLNDDQKKKLETITNEYQQRYTAMTSKREIAFKNAVARTKQLLNDQQRQKYEQILARRMGSEGGNQPQPDSTHPAPTFSASMVSKGVESPG